MSVPVRYSAAANYAVAASGLSNTLQQEEQHHQQQQATPFQLFQQHQHQPAQHHQQLPFSSFNSYGHGLEQQQHQQQQLMQQRSSMSSSVSVSGTSSSSSSSPSASLPIIRPVNPIITVVSGKQAKNKKRNGNNNKNKKMMMQQQQQQKQKHHHPKQQQQHHQLQQQKLTKQQQQKPKQQQQQGAGQSIIPASALKSTMSGRNGGGRATTINSDDDDMKPTTSAMAAAARAARATAAAAAVQASAATAALPLAVAEGANALAGAADAEMRTEWMRMSAEGRYGDPDAAGHHFEKPSAGGDAELAGASASCNATATNDQPMDNEMTSGAADNAMDALNDSPAFSPHHHGGDQRLNDMTSDELFGLLKEYDVLQDKYHTVLLLPKESRREVTAGGRDGSAYVLRCLKMWYELPSDVLFSAMSLVDRFLDRMAVKPKHMACMSVASFHLAIKQLDLKPIPADDLVTISQCGCTPGDLERMAGVIANKLGVHLGTGQAPITSVSYLRVYYALFRNVAKDIGGQFFEFYEQLIKLEDLENRLEILLCDVKTTVIAPSTLALVLICLHLDFHIKESYTRGSPELKHVFEYILFLQQYMRIPDRVFSCGFSIVSGILSHYNGQNKQPYKQRLVWKLSSRTLRVLRPTNRFSSDLPTIEEGIPNAMDDGLRSRTESISSEEEEDWPTSPIIPIFEQC